MEVITENLTKEYSLLSEAPNTATSFFYHGYGRISVILQNDAPAQDDPPHFILERGLRTEFGMDNCDLKIYARSSIVEDKLTICKG